MNNQFAKAQINAETSKVHQAPNWNSNGLIASYLLFELKMDLGRPALKQVDVLIFRHYYFFSRQLNVFFLKKTKIK